MKRKTKIWVIIGISLMLIGSIIFTGVMSVFKWDFKKLSTVKYETNNYDISEDYKNISVITDTADVVFVPSEDDKTTVVCYEQIKLKHTVSVKNGTFTIELDDQRKWYEHITVFDFGTPKITVYVPKGDYGNLLVKVSTGDVEISVGFKFQNIDITGSTGDTVCQASAEGDIKISRSTGNIKIENATAGNVSLTTTTGDVNLSNIKCNDLSSSGNTGDFAATNVIVAQEFSIKRTTGDIKLAGCDAQEIFITTDTGDVTGTLLSDKVFICSTDTGHTDVPKTITGGRCEVTTDTGNIKFEIVK